MNNKTSDLDLMRHVDGDTDTAEDARVSKELESSTDARAKVQSLRQVGEVLRTYVELSVDDAGAAAEPQWARIERAIRSNGQATTTERIPDTAASPAEGGSGWWQGLSDWMSGWQGHAVSAAAAAAAVVLVMNAVKPDRVVERTTVIRDHTTPAVPVALELESQPPEVESLEVYDGSGMVLTIPGEDDDSSTAVIWISSGTDVEEPI